MSGADTVFVTPRSAVARMRRQRSVLVEALARLLAEFALGVTGDEVLIQRVLHGSMDPDLHVDDE